MINILLGPSGHGKSTYIMNMIKNGCEKGRRSFLIVPEQQTVISERKLASLLPPSACLCAEVVNFTRLANEVFRKVGGLKYNYIDKSGKNLIMYRAVCEVRNLLTEYKIQKGHEKGCVALFLDAIGELKSYDVGTESLEEAAGKIEGGRLKARINDIILVYSTYEKILGERYSDPYDDIMILSKKLDEYRYFDGTDVYIDSFYGFTKAQENVLYKIVSQAQNVTFAFDCPTDDCGIQYEKISQTAKSIEKMCRTFGKSVEKKAFPTDFKHTGEPLRYLCKNIWNFSAAQFSYSDGIEIVEAENEFDECDITASKIEALIHSGAKYSDIAIISRNPDTYRGIIDVSLKKYDIPYYISARSDFTSKPVIKMIFSSLSAIQNYRTEDIISYLKCGYTDIDDNAVCEIEDYIYRWNIYGKKFQNDDFWSSNPDGYDADPSITQIEKLAHINDTRDYIISKFSILECAFSGSCTVKDGAKAVFDFLCAHKTKEKLESEIKILSAEEALETSQIWNLLISSLDTLVTVMGDSEVNAETFLTLLRYTFDGKTVGTIPTGDDTVTIGDASVIRTDRIKHAFILGANESVFPANVEDDGFFSDDDKISLENVGIILSSRNDLRSSDELMFFANALSLPSDSVCISYISADITGSAKQPSSGIKRITDLFGNIKIIKSSTFGIADRIYTKESAKEYLSCLQDESVKEGIFRAIGETIDACEGFSNESLSISKGFARQLFSNNLSLTQSKIETFLDCKLNYYCKHVLNLKASNRYSISSKEVGTFTHKVFEEFLKEARDKNLDFSSLDDKKIEEIADRIICEYLKALYRRGYKTNRLKHMFERLRSRLIVYLKDITREFAQSDFSPEFFELSFAGDSDNAPIPLQFKIGETASATIGGIADRVDILRKDGVTYVRVVDYKSKSKKISLDEIANGREFQMLIYLFTLCKMSDCSFRKKLLDDSEKLCPAGVLYYPMNINSARANTEAGISSAEKAEEVQERAIANIVEKNGIFLDNESILRAQDKELNGEFIPKYPSKSKDVFISLEKFDELYASMEKMIEDIGAEIFSGDASAIPDKKAKHSPCDYCDNRAVCRRRQI